LNKRIAAFCLAILLPIAGTAAARDGAVPEHDIRVELDPASGDIRIADRFRIEGRERFEFTLASWLEIESLSIDGEVSAPRQAGGVWQVSLPGPGVHELDFELAGTLPPRAPGQAELTASSGADGAYLPAYEDWIPRDPAVALRYRLQVSVPAAQRAVATGKMLDEESRDGRRLAVFEQANPGEAPSLFAGPYQVRESLRDGLRVRTYFHDGLDPFAEAYLAASRAYIERYADEIGAYPYADFDVVSAPLPVGLGFPNLTYVGRRVIPLPFMRGRSLAHEVLHNWWGNAVEVDYRNGNWAEGLTTYMADYALERDKGEAEARSMRIRWLRDYAALPAARDRPVRDFRAKRHQASQVIGYNKTAFVFHMLELEIGRRDFVDGLRLFWQRHRFGSASWSDLQAAFEQVSGRGLGWFFSQWLDRPGAPRLSLGDHSVERVGEDYRTRIDILQPVTGYRFHLPVLLVTADGRERHEIEVSESLTTVEWLTDARPLSIQLDPDSDLFRKLQANEAPPILRDITLDSHAATIIDSGDEEFTAVARELAARLFETEPHVESLSRAEKSSRPLLLITLDENLPQLLSRAQLKIPEQLPSGDYRAAAWTARLPGGKPVLVISADNVDELRALLRPLPHYGGQSYVLFAAGRALDRGIWPITRGALYRDLSDG
jgi:hypothetical protein